MAHNTSKLSRDVRTRHPYLDHKADVEVTRNAFELAMPLASGAITPTERLYLLASFGMNGIERYAAGLIDTSGEWCGLIQQGVDE